jgi:Uri superfamily endonuclease
LIEKQKAYFNSGNIYDLKPLTQKKAADQLRVNASWIHYIIKDKNILIPNGKTVPLRSLFFSQKKWVQLRLEAILSRESRNNPYKDSEIQRQIQLKYKKEISLRGICGYRRSLRIPAWYKRKKRGDTSRLVNFSAEYLLTKKNYKKYIPSKAGIYVFKKGIKCFYVGSSGNLRKRIRTHLYNGSKNKKLSEYIRLNKCAFQYAIINRDWKAIERQLYLDFIKTHAAPPLFNKLRP